MAISILIWILLIMATTPYTIIKTSRGLNKALFKNMSILDSISYSECEEFSAKVIKSDFVNSAKKYVSTFEIEDGTRRKYIEHWSDMSFPVGSIVTIEAYPHPSDVTRKPFIQVIM